MWVHFDIAVVVLCDHIEQPNHIADIGDSHDPSLTGSPSMITFFDHQDIMFMAGSLGFFDGLSSTT